MNFNEKENKNNFSQSSGESNSLPSATSSKPSLSGVVSRTSVEDIINSNVYRKYIGNITTSCLLKGNTDVSVKPVLYEIGLRSCDEKEVFKRVSPQYGIAQTITTSQVVLSELTGLHKRFPAFSGIFEYCDLSAIGHQLGRALGFYTSTGTLNCAMIRGGEEASIIHLGTSVDPVSASRNSVFIPRDLHLDDCPGAFYVLAASANAYGSTVFSNFTPVDAAGSVILNEPVDESCVIGVFQAMRILLKLYSDSGYGDVMALAITRGLHSSLSVVGHTDEGAYMRRVFRRGGYAAPFGGILSNEPKGYRGIPIPVSRNRAIITGIIDGIALATAGLVSVCAPTCLKDGLVYPRVFSSSALTPDGKALEIARRISESSGEFSELYCKSLATLFGVTGSDALSSRALQAAFASCCAESDRHLKYETVSPFYWIEPTSLFSQNFATPSNDAGFGCLTLTTEKKEISLFPEAKELSNYASATMITYEHRSARTVGYALHCSSNVLDGLAYVLPAQFAPDEVVLCGSVEGPNHLIDQRSPLSSYMWVRGQSPIPAPAEFIYTGGHVKAYVLHAYMDPDTFLFSNNHTVMRGEMNNKVEITCAAPNAVKSGKLGVVPRDICRKRNCGAEALMNAVIRSGASAEADYGSFIFSKSAVKIARVSDPLPPILQVDSSALEQSQSRSHELKGNKLPVIGLGLPANGIPPPAVRRVIGGDTTFTIKGGILKKTGQLRNDGPVGKSVPGTVSSSTVTPLTPISQSKVTSNNEFKSLMNAVGKRGGKTSASVLTPAEMADTVTAAAVIEDYVKEAGLSETYNVFEQARLSMLTEGYSEDYINAALMTAGDSLSTYVDTAYPTGDLNIVMNLPSETSAGVEHGSMEEGAAPPGAVPQ
jgi:hypothetical protein